MVSSLPRATSASDDRALNTLFEGEATQQGKSLALMKLEDLDKLLDQLVTNITTISDTISERAVMLGKITYRTGLSVHYDVHTILVLSVNPSVYTTDRCSISH